MRFDDAVQTVLAAETASAFGAASAWRQLVDLIGRGRAGVTPEALTRLTALRARVPGAVRAASARAIAFAAPPAGLVGLFAMDEPAIAAPVLRAAKLDGEEWIALLPAMPAHARALLRHRRDLPANVVRALASFGPSDFALPPAAGDTADADAIPVSAERASDAARREPAPVRAPDPDFVDIASVARAMPLVAEAFRRSTDSPAPPHAEPRGPFPIAELVARIDAYTKARDETGASAPATIAPISRFRFETDADGIVRWVEGVPREPLIGLALDRGSALARVDGAVAAATRQRQPFADGRLVVAGGSSVAGQWRVSATPLFDPATGRFNGFRGIARRPRVDQRADREPGDVPPPEALRQLVHELRTPTNAIAGFAEMIGEQILGPVPPVYRERASTIRSHVGALLAAIDDLDWAARLDSQALTLRPRRVEVAPLLARVAGDLAALTELRGAALAISPGPDAMAIAADEIAAERIVGRLLATLIAAAGAGERLAVTAREEAGQVAIAFDRPHALSGHTAVGLWSVDDDNDGSTGAPLLGTGFALRLARNLAVELGGSLAIGPECLTLRLPAALIEPVEQLSSR